MSAITNPAALSRIAGTRGPDFTPRRGDVVRFRGVDYTVSDLSSLSDGIVGMTRPLVEGTRWEPLDRITLVQPAPEAAPLPVPPVAPTPPPAVPLRKLPARDLAVGDVVHAVHVRPQPEPVTVDALTPVGRANVLRVTGHTASDPVSRVIWQGIARTTDVLVERTGPDEPVEGYGDPAPTNRVRFVVEFDSAAWATMDADERAAWIDRATDALADEAHVVEVSTA